METKEKIEAIRQACIKANPEIVELKFGCEFREAFHNEDGNFVVKGESLDGLAFFGSIEKSAYGEVFRYTKEYAKDNLEIIGRPIRLADVLMAICEKGFTPPVIVSVGGTFYHQRADTTIGFPIGTWDIKKDDLTLQSPETVDFIFNLLK